jgi:hypothetical protein
MRIAAGVLLIIAAIMNGIAGLGYVTAGGASAVVGAAAEEANKQAAAEGKASEADLKAVADAADKATAAGGGLMLFGIFLVAMLGLQIAGGVVLFMQKAATFAMVVGVLGIIAEVAGIALTAFGVTNILGLVASGLAILASRGYAKNKAGGGSMAAAA